MKISFKSILGIIFGVSAFMFYVSNVRPVGWFDSLVGILLGIIVFIVIKRFKGLEKPIILLVNLEENLNDEKKMRDIYSGLSRARGHLIIVSNQNSINFLKELYAT